MPVTDTKLITPTTMARPAYLVPVAEPGFGSTLTRIGGDTGYAIPGLSPDKWHSDARHHYSRDNPWNCDGTLADLEQRGGTPSKFIVDAKTWRPILGNVGNFRACGDSRWHPTLPTVMVGYNKSTRELVIFDALTNQTIKRISVPFTFQSSNGGFMGEGSLSNDASVVALGDEANNVIMVDITSGRVSPVQKVDFIRAPGHKLGNITVSPLSTPAGGKVVAKASDKPELVHVYKYGADLMLKSHFESNLTLSHGDVGLTPAGREVFCGGSREWFGVSTAFGAGSRFEQANGRIAAIHLDDGEIRNISAGSKQLGSKEAADQHCSLRGPKGWVLVTYAGAQETSGRFLMELVAWPLSGSRECIRFGVSRTNETGIYRAEAHGVMRPSNPFLSTAVMFASNWQHAANPKGATTDIKSFVYELAGAPPPPPPSTPALDRFYNDPSMRAYPTGAIRDRGTNTTLMLDDAARLLTKAYPTKVTG